MFRPPNPTVFPFEAAASATAGQQQQFQDYQQQQQLQQQYQHQLLLAQGKGNSAPGQPFLRLAASPAAVSSPADRSLFLQEYHHLHHPGTLQHASPQQRLLQQPVGVAAASLRPNQFALPHQSPATALQACALQNQQQQSLAFANGGMAGFSSPGDPLHRLPQSLYAHQPRPYSSPDNFAAYPLQHTAEHAPQSPMGLHGPPHVPPQSLSPTKAGLGAGVPSAWQKPMYAVGSLRADLQPKPAPFFTGDAAPPNSDKATQPESLSTNPSASTGFSFAEAERPVRLAADGASVPIDDDAPPIHPLGSGPQIAGDYQDIQGSSVGAIIPPKVGSAEEVIHSTSLAQSTYKVAALANDGISSVDVTNSVIIFGFPLDATSYILSQFRNYGEIVRHKASPDAENWLIATYATRLGAQTALAKNGRVFGGQLMIGVLPAPEDVVPVGSRMSASPMKDAAASGLLPPRSPTGPPVDGAPPPAVGSRQTVVPKTAQIFHTQAGPTQSNQSPSRDGGKEAENEGGSRKAENGVYQKISNALWGW